MTKRIFFELLCFLLSTALAASMKTLTYELPGRECDRTRREVDSVVIHSSENKISECYLKFFADDSPLSTKRFMIQIKTAKFTSCSSDMQMFFYSDYKTRPADVTLNCLSSANLKKTIITPNRYLTIRFNKTSSAGYKFEIIATAFTADHSCNGMFRCTSTKYCVDEDLVCDGVDNCFDKSDEMCTHKTEHENAHEAQPSYKAMGTMVGLIIGVLSAAMLICILIVICCKRYRVAGSNTNSALTSDNLCPSSCDQQPIATSAVYGQPTYAIGYPIPIAATPPYETLYPCVPIECSPPPYPATEGYNNYPTPSTNGSRETSTDGNR